VSGGPDIPGLRGAPMRTPVKPTGAASGPELWPALAGRMLTRQLWIELYGLPGYGATLGGTKVAAFACAPKDPRPVDATLGRSVLDGRFVLAGTAMDAAAPEDPWNRPSPSQPFAAQLHAFAWLPHLMAEGERGAREALRLVRGWEAVFRRWSPFVWDPDRLARRVFNLSCAARRLGSVADEADRLALAVSLSRQARQLLRAPDPTARRAERLTAAALAGCVLTGPVGAGLRRRALSRLPRALVQAVGDDGGHALRSPEAGLELLLDLVALSDALGQIGEPVPEPVTQAVTRLGRGVRTLALPDGRMGSYHGGGPSNPASVVAALGPVEASEPGVACAGFARLQSPLLTVLADVAAPPRGAWGAEACAQPMALEIVCGKDRLVTGCGWTPLASDRQGLRLTPGHSTLTLGESSLGEPLSGWRAEVLGARLAGKPYAVRTERRDGDGAVWLEIEHDGWTPPFGLTHQRRLYLDQRMDELRAEERLFPTPGRPDVTRQIAAPYAIRFHLEPGVQASLARDRRSILLRGHSSRGWWFRTDGPDVAIEPSVHVDGGLTRRSLQIVVRGSARTDAETKVRWKLSPAGGAGDPV
jgi:uncharacterized heparinase superfamily protein